MQSNRRFECRSKKLAKASKQEREREVSCLRPARAPVTGKHVQKCVKIYQGHHQRGQRAGSSASIYVSDKHCDVVHEVSIQSGLRRAWPSWKHGGYHLTVDV